MGYGLGFEVYGLGLRSGRFAHMLGIAVEPHLEGQGDLVSIPVASCSPYKPHSNFTYSHYEIMNLTTKSP